MKTLILDLDDTIYPTASIPSSFAQPILEAMLHYNEIQKDFNTEVLYQIYKDFWLIPFDQIQVKYNISREFSENIHFEFTKLELKQNLQPFEDYELLKSISNPKILVTTGFNKLQKSKLTMLNIVTDYHEIHIDTLDFPEKRKGKKQIFSEIMRRLNLDSENVLVIGDNPESELKAGNELGLKCIQILRPGIEKSDKIRHHINTFYELESYLI